MSGTNTMLEKLKAFLESDEGMRKAEEYFGKIRNRQTCEDRWIEKCVKLIEPLDNLDELFAKYKKHSDKKKDILFKQGIDGDTELSNVVLGAFEKLGREPKESELPDILMFTSAIYVYKGIIAELCVGQGSFIAVYKV